MSMPAVCFRIKQLFSQLHFLIACLVVCQLLWTKCYCWWARMGISVFLQPVKTHVFVAIKNNQNHKNRFCGENWEEEKHGRVGERRSFGTKWRKAQKQQRKHKITNSHCCLCSCMSARSDQITTPSQSVTFDGQSQQKIFTLTSSSLWTERDGAQGYLLPLLSVVQTGG